jgi:hypothetical protein
MSSKVHKPPRQPGAKANGFNRLYHEIVDTEAFLFISVNGALPLLIYIWRRYNGYNNGRITYSQREVERLFGCSSKRAVRWFRVLQKAGFIVAVRHGSFSQKTGAFAARATIWRLTMEPYADQGATRDYLRFKSAGVPNA